MSIEELSQALKQIEKIIPYEGNCNVMAISTNHENLLHVASRLKQNSDLCFDMLSDHTAIDLLEEGSIELVYQLYSTKYGYSLMLSTKVSRDNPLVTSVSSLWEIAEWQEREVYDMFGVIYKNHPDLRRLFLEDDWEGYPLRKDYSDDFMVELPYE